MNLPHQLARYGNVKVMTASPAEHIVMLYDASFRFLREAIEACKAKDPARMGERIGRAHNIYAHLLAALDRNMSPKLCDLLEPLYSFCMRHIVEANLKQDPEKLEEVIRVLLPMRTAWATAADELVKQRALAKAG